jgi:hypothetical protein
LKRTSVRKVVGRTGGSASAYRCGLHRGRIDRADHSTSNNPASCSMIVPPSCSTSMIVTARL